MLLDDTSPLVRQAMAEVFARNADAPAAIVRALSLDQPSVALPVLEHSPASDRRRPRRHRRDRQLRDAMRDRTAHQSAGFRRCRDRRSRHRGRGLELIENARRRARAISSTASSSATAISPPSAKRCWCSTTCRPRRARRWSRNSRTRWRSSSSPGTGSAPSGQGGWPTRPATARRFNIAAPFARRRDAGLVAHLRETGQLTAGLILRALLSGNLELFDAALVELVGTAAGAGHRAPARARRDQPEGAAEARRPAGIDVRGLPRGAGGMS